MTTDRVRVTHPRTEAARRPPVRATTKEIEEQTDLGQWYVASLIRSQRRLAAVVTIGAIGVLVAIALLPSLAPGWIRWRVLGLSVPWLVLGLAIYPAMIVVAALAVRQAERNERAFRELVHHR